MLFLKKLFSKPTPKQIADTPPAFRIPRQPPLFSGESYKNFKHLDDDLLYTDNEYALNFLKKELENAENSRIVESSPKPSTKGKLAQMLGAVATKPKAARTKYHSYWYGELNEKHLFSIKSLLCTQKNAQVCLWLDEKTYAQNAKNKHFKTLKALKNDIYIYI